MHGIIRRFRRPVVIVRALLLALLASACSPEGGTAQRGGALVLNQPRVSIGVADGDSAYLLFGVWEAQRTADGRIVVGNTGTQQIRIYDARGRHVRTVGRKGSGPGEFQGLQQIGLARGDTIVAYDIMLGRISVFSPAGDYVRSHPVQPFGNNVLPRALGITGSGDLLVRTDFDRIFVKGPRRDTVQVGLLGARGVRAELGRYGAEEAFIVVRDGGASRREIAFGRNTYASARGDRIAIGSSDAYAVHVFDASGRRVRTVQQAYTPRRVERADVRAADEEYLANIPERFRANIEKDMNQYPHGQTVPAFGGVLVGADGSLWVQDYPIPGRPERSWTVFDSAGVRVRQVRAGSAMRLVDAGTDYVIGRVRDDMGVERILVFDLPR